MSGVDLSASVGRALVLSEGATASTDYYLLPHLRKIGYSSELRDARLKAIHQVALAKFQIVVVSRYFPNHWRRSLARFRKAGGRVAYFMDDDLFDMRVLKSLPARYQWKIFRHTILRRRELVNLCDEYWMSTPYLVRKYKKMNPVLLRPAPPESLLTSKPSVWICYHGTASHIDELDWLLKVMGPIQEQSEITHFEIFGGSKVKRHYAGVPRVSVIQPMSWPNYLDRTGSTRRDIALAPMLSAPFNAGRGHTKFFDYARMGAAGVYSDVAPYRDFIRDGVDGILVKNDPLIWVEVILGMVTDSERRNRIAQQARQRAFAMGCD